MEPMSQVNVDENRFEERNNAFHWNLFGRNIHKQEFTYFSTVCILFTVIIACLVNLSLNKGPTEVWLSLLASSVGILVPSPQIKALQLPK